MLYKLPLFSWSAGTLRNLPILENHDAVAVHDCRQSVRNHVTRLIRPLAASLMLKMISFSVCVSGEEVASLRSQFPPSKNIQTVYP